MSTVSKILFLALSLFIQCDSTKRCSATVYYDSVDTTLVQASMDGGANWIIHTGGYKDPSVPLPIANVNENTVIRATGDKAVMMTVKITVEENSNIVNTHTFYTGNPLSLHDWDPTARKTGLPASAEDIIYWDYNEGPWYSYNHGKTPLAGQSHHASWIYLNTIVDQAWYSDIQLIFDFANQKHILDSLGCPGPNDFDTSQCWNPVSCASETITNNDETQCFGYKSCYRSDFDTTDDIICSGEYACAGSGGGFAIKSTNGDIECSGYSSCYGWNDGIPVTSTNGDIECSGYRSCSNSPMSGTNFDCSGNYACSGSTSSSCNGLCPRISAQTGVQCSGVRSCYAQSITARSVTCSSRESCMYADFYRVMLASFEVICSGELSCDSTQVHGGGASHSKVIASGKESMNSAKIEADTVIGTGYESLKKAKITTSKGTKSRASVLNVELLGHNTGSEAKVECPNGAECTLTCAGNACEDTTFICASGSKSCKIYPIGCGVYSENLNEDTRVKKPKPTKAPKTKKPKPTKATKAPKTKNPKPTKAPKTKKPKPTPKPVSTTPYPTTPPPNNPKLIDPITGTICPNFIDNRIMDEKNDDQSELINGRVRETKQSEIDDDEIEPLIGGCENALSCVGETNPSNKIDGYKSCEGCSLTYNDDINCNGYRSCMSSTITATGGASEAVGCQGPFSCYNAGFIDNPKGPVICSGKQSCVDIGLIKGCERIYCTGKHACKGSNIELTYKDTYAGKVNCEAFESCKETTIKMPVGSTLSCYGEYSCSEGEFDTTGAINCEGYKSCFESNIQNSKMVILDGELSGAENTFTDVSIIYAYGKRSLENSNIFGLNRGFSAYLWGFESGKDATLECSQGSVCSLECKQNGCENTKYICQSGSTCSITPQDCKGNSGGVSSDGIKCPIITDYGSSTGCYSNIFANGDGSIKISLSRDNGNTFNAIDMAIYYTLTTQNRIHVNENTRIRFEVTDTRSDTPSKKHGGFVAAIDIINANDQKLQYLTDNPLTNFDVMSGSSGTLYYDLGSNHCVAPPHGKCSNIYYPLLPNNAYWIWTGYKLNTMVFEFNFGKHKQALINHGCIINHDYNIINNNNNDNRIENIDFAKNNLEEYNDSNVWWIILLLFMVISAARIMVKKCKSKEYYAPIKQKVNEMNKAKNYQSIA